MTRGLSGIGEETRRFDDDGDIQVDPRDGSGIAFREHTHIVAVDRKPVVTGRYIPLVPAVSRVVLQQMRQLRRVSKVINGNDAQPIGMPLLNSAVYLPANPSEAVDPDSSLGI